MAVVVQEAGSAGCGLVGKVPVRSLWLLMLYASDLFRCLGNKNVAIEENPDDIPDLVAEILVQAVRQRLRRDLSVGYVQREKQLA